PADAGLTGAVLGVGVVDDHVEAHAGGVDAVGQLREGDRRLEDVALVGLGDLGGDPHRGRDLLDRALAVVVVASGDRSAHAARAVVRAGQRPEDEGGGGVVGGAARVD